MTAANQSWTVAVANTGSAVTSAGAVTLTMVSLANLAVGQAVSGPSIAAGTVITALGGNTLTLSVPVTAAIPASTKLSFGAASAAASPSETYRLAYNAYLRQHAAVLGCGGLVDPDSIFADPVGSGKWRTDLGQASVDGVHPSPALHQAAVNAGLIKPTMFQPP